MFKAARRLCCSSTSSSSTSLNCSKTASHNILVEQGKPFAYVSQEVKAVRSHILGLVDKHDSEILDTAAKYALAAPGKLMRPALVALMGYATLPPERAKQLRSSFPSHNLDDVEVPASLQQLQSFSRHIRLAEVTELIHTASLVHDDVIDNSTLRRGRKATHIQIGSIKSAVLAGDFMLARASHWIATLENTRVVMLMTKALEDLTSGEIMQDRGCFDIPTYLQKSYCKTASLIDNSLASTAVLSCFHNNINKEQQSGAEAYVQAASAFGRHLGVAFQIVDDCLDITGSEEEMGKPKLNDLKEGTATLPALLAAEQDAQIDAMVKRKFSDAGDVAAAVEGMTKYNTIAQALEMADHECRQAIDALHVLHPSEARDKLEEAVQVVLTRRA